MVKRKRTRARSRGLPAWYKGKLINDDVDDTWEGERTGKMLKQRGLNVTRTNFENLTDKERIEQLQGRI